MTETETYTLAAYSELLSPGDPGWLGKALAGVDASLEEGEPDRIRAHTGIHTMGPMTQPFYHREGWYTDLYVPEGCSRLLLIHMVLHAYDLELMDQVHAGKDMLLSNSRRILHNRLRQILGEPTVHDMEVQAAPGRHSLWYRLASWVTDMEIRQPWGTVLEAGDKG